MADFFARGTTAAPRETGDPRVDRWADPARSARGAVVARTAIAGAEVAAPQRLPVGRGDVRERGVGHTVRACDVCARATRVATTARDFAIEIRKATIIDIMGPPHQATACLLVCDEQKALVMPAGGTDGASKHPDFALYCSRPDPPRHQTRRAAHRSFRGEPTLASIHSLHAREAPARRGQGPCVRASSLATRAALPPVSRPN